MNFSIKSDLKQSVAHCVTLKDYFNYFIDEKMIDLIVYATNKKSNNQVKPVNICEIRGFIGLLLLFGVTNKNHMSVNEIWAVEKLHHSDQATSSMKRERFKEIGR
jgi:hypothetical protein